MYDIYMDNIRSYVEKKLPEMRLAVDTFLGPMKLISFDEDNKKITFGVAYKEEAVSLVKRRFATVIQEAVEDTIGKGYEISFQLMINEWDYKPYHLNPQRTFATYQISKQNGETVERLRNFLTNKSAGIMIIHSDGAKACGKTHLLQALSHESQAEDREEIAFFTAETYASYLVEGLTRENLSRYKQIFLEDYRNIIIDDIEFIFDKENASHYLAELLKTCEDGRHFLLSLDRWPRNDIHDEELREILNNAEVLLLTPGTSVGVG